MSRQMQSYAYQGASALFDGRLVLQTSGGCTDRGPAANPRFFTGFLTASQAAAAGLLALADLAGTDFRRTRQRPRRTGSGAALLEGSSPGSSQGRLDPIVTSGGDRLRFESLSACCGVYGRLDVLAPGLDGDLATGGTTNVDVNAPLYTALTRIGGGDPLRLVVGPDDMIVTTLDGAVAEKKVPLPERWLRSLAEVPAITVRFDPRAEVTVPEAAAFLNRLPAATSPQVRWLTQVGRSLRTAAAPSRGAVCLAGANRLALLRPLLRHARGLRLFGPPVTPDSGPAPSGWELDLGAMRFILLLSPGPSRGFSGEGALLPDLAGEAACDDAGLVAPLLGWAPLIDTAAVTQASGLTRDRVRSALAALATSGRVGYDLAEAAYFHRELPFDPAHVTRLNPRLAAARALVENDHVTRSGDGFEVRSGEQVYQVYPLAGGGFGCTCTWWAEHQGQRGPCKHALAALSVTRPVGNEQ